MARVRRRVGGRTIAVSVGLAILVLVAGGVATIALTRGPSGGPLAPGSGTGGLAVSADPDRPITFAFVLPAYRGSAPAVLDSLTAVRPTPGIRVVGVDVLTQSENAHSIPSDSVPAFPPPGFVLHPLHNFAYRASLGKIQVVIGVSVRAGQGIFSVHGWILRYRVGGRAYQATYQQFVSLCVPTSRYPTCNVTVSS